MRIKQKYTPNIFMADIEEEAIDRIKRFAELAEKMNLDICIGFSGGKDSQVTLDLCRRAGIKYTAYFNHAFESPVTLQFIREYYPDVIFRRDYKIGFLQNIEKHGFILPTREIAFCCADYKHNPKYVDKCSIVGVRKAESRNRRSRTVLSLKNKTISKKNTVISDYFKESCSSLGTASDIQLLPIVDWTDSDVWQYIDKYKLPINPEYNIQKRVGCIVCPKVGFDKNYHNLVKYPKIIDAVIHIRDRGETDWKINSENVDYKDDKFYYVCRWLNASFKPFQKKQQKLYEKLKSKYYE